jgi:diguanylate cyclase (GGDEF)-like protein
LSSPESGSGHVLLLTDDREEAVRLTRWIAATGLPTVVVSGAEKFLMNEGDDESVHLVVTDLDTDDPSVLILLERLVSGDLFRGLPHLHVVRDFALLTRLRHAHPSLVPFSMAAPPPAEEFQARVRLAAEIGRLRRETARTSLRDALTGLLNRRYLLLRLEEEFSRARRYRTPLSVLTLDIDHLKDVNDAHGLEAGDVVIRRIGQLLRGQMRREDVLGRIGEDVFGVVLTGNRFRGAAVFANKIRTEVEETVVDYRDVELQVTIAAGITTFPDNPVIRTSEDMLRIAENALREAKARGGNRVFIDEGVMKKERRIILVADPDADLLDLTEDLLSLDDFRVVKASTSRTALETLRFRRPDLVVLDLTMTDPETGRSLVESIQQIFPGTRFPIIGLSRDPAADPDTLSRLGVDRFITKPFSLTLLRSAARELVETYRV